MNTPHPHKMPTSRHLASIDPMRELLRDHAEREFAVGRYAQFRAFVTHELAHWRTSPTACFLMAMASTYEADATSPPDTRLLATARDHLRLATTRWDLLLDARDLVDVDATLVHTSIEMLAAWIRKLDEAPDARTRVLARLAAVRASEAWRASRNPALLHCPYWYLILFACKDEQARACEEILAMLDRDHPDWTADLDFVSYVEGRREFGFFKSASSWSTRLAQARVLHTMSRGAHMMCLARPADEIENVGQM